MQALATVAGSLGIAAFSRQPDGGFAPLGPPPEWFVRVTSGDTFPFLGHILEEASAFWQRGTQGRADWGPVAEVDEQGREYHYIVTALTVGTNQYLVFQLDAGAERMREVLQKVRSEALSAEQDQASHRAASAELHKTTNEMKHLLAQVMRTDLTPQQLELVKGLSQQVLSLTNGIGKLIQSTLIPRV
ncbi:MAG: hypothetical protein U0Q55_01045 [Vicinamibacterales bacterium]